MRIDVPLTTDLALGSKKRTLDPNDAHVDVPGAIMPVIEILSPVGAAFGPPTQNEASFVTEYQVNKTNTAAWNDQVVSLAPGLWDLNFQFYFSLTVATALSATELIHVLLQNPAAIQLVIRSWFLVTEGGQFWNSDFRILLRDTHDIRVTGPATAVGDNLFFGFDLLANKLI